MAAGVDKEKKRCTSVCKEFAKLNAFPALYVIHSYGLHIPHFLSRNGSADIL